MLSLWSSVDCNLFARLMYLSVFSEHSEMRCIRRVWDSRGALHSGHDLLVTFGFVTFD